IIHCSFFFFQAEDGIRDFHVTGVQTCALPISAAEPLAALIRRGIGLVMVTGDSLAVARAVAKPLGIEQIHAAATPEDKVRIVRRSEERRVGKEWRSRWSLEQCAES